MKILEKTSRDGPSRSGISTHCHRNSREGPQHFLPKNINGQITEHKGINPMQVYRDLLRFSTMGATAPPPTYFVTMTGQLYQYTVVSPPNIEHNSLKTLERTIHLPLVPPATIQAQKYRNDTVLFQRRTLRVKVA